MASEAEFDIVVFGATGYTGGLVAEHLARNYSGPSGVRWALAGRSPESLAATRARLDAPDDLALIVADASDAASVRAMVDRTRVLITTAGPYRPHGAAVVEACAATGTDYLDLCGEPAWMRRMIDEHGVAAEASGARIMFGCGYDSLPSELGVWFCQQVARERLGEVVPQVKARVRAFVGGISGGSAASRDSIIDAVTNQPGVAELMADPFGLTPGFRGPEQPSMDAPRDDPDVGPVIPFMLGATNAKAVHRANFLLGHPYGTDFVYDEMQTSPPVGADPALAAADGGQPKPGEGPSEEARLAGSFDVLFIGRAGERQVRVSVKGDLDPGYGSTAKMMAETAVCALQTAAVVGGMWTPGAALQPHLLDRLAERAGLTFTDESDRVRDKAAAR